MLHVCVCVCVREREREREKGGEAYSPQRHLILGVEGEVVLGHGLGPGGGQLQLGPVRGELEESWQEGEGQTVTAVVRGVGHED